MTVNKFMDSEKLCVSFLFVFP